MPNPRLEGEFALPMAGADARVVGFGAGLAWDVSPLLARSARRSSARLNRQTVDLEIAWQEWQVAQAARLHAVRLIHLERRLALGERTGAHWRRLLQELRAAEAVTPLESVRAQGAAAQRELRRLELARGHEREGQALRVAMGLEESQPLELDRGGRPAVEPPPLEELLRALPERRLDLVALARARDAHSQSVRAAASARFPAIELGVHGAREVDGLASVGVRVSVGISFFDRNQGAREPARHGLCPWPSIPRA